MRQAMQLHRIYFQVTKLRKSSNDNPNQKERNGDHADTADPQ